MTFTLLLTQFKKEGKLPSHLVKTLKNFYHSYSHAVQENGHSIQEYEVVLEQFLSEVIKYLQAPHLFESYHERVRSPVDYYQLGLDVMRPLVIFEKSHVLGEQNVKRMEEQLAKGENVILFANHQTEPDPQAISLLLEKAHSKFAEEMIFLAGHRVVSDPLAVPFSLGRNLLCIYSKKYINYPPEKKEEKLQHNQKTMKKLGQLLAEGGKCIYVAPSGGRDRPNAEGVVEVAKFDPQSIEMFWLLSQYSDHPTHFYPLSLVTYDLLPPPNSIAKELGEPRQAQCTPIQLAFGAEIDMQNFPGSDVKDKRQKRKVRSEYIWEQVKKDYNTLATL